MKFKWIRHNGDVYRDLGVDKDGSLYNPNGYPEDLVRTVVGEAQARRHQRASAAAKRAAKTRQQRKEKRIYELVQRLKDGGTFTSGTHCEICGRGLDDPASLARGIGSECWQSVMALLTERQRA